MLFQEFVNEEKTIVRIIDATRSMGKVAQRDFLVDDIISRGYEIYRKQ